jgi:acyl carrier protein
MQQTIETLVRYVGQELLDGSSGANLKADDNLLTSGLIDSLGIIRLVNFIEDAFDIEVRPEDITIENFRTIHVIAEYLETRRS